HAPWALDDHGFRVIIAPSFADIFYNNCFKNSILPITLSSDLVENLFNEGTEGYQLAVDLKTQTIITPNKQVINFDIDPSRKERLLRGLDDIALTLQQADEIKVYESQRAKRAPWLFA
ncbi:MAG: 3-isopropylmalate dehydratase small subunit, partial [Methylococcales bacterium]|nr:3-isopropylmalate dehydratase small subunit [Methylococcales bacterium]